MSGNLSLVYYKSMVVNFFKHKVLIQYFKRQSAKNLSTKIKNLQGNLKSKEYNESIFSDLLSVETRDILTTGQLQLDSVKILLEYCAKITGINFLNECIIDVGANVGLYARFFSKMFQSVISLEPNPTTYKILEFNTRNFENVQILNLGASSAEGMKKLSGNKEHSGSFSMEINNSKKSDLNSTENLEEFDVQVVKITDLFVGDYLRNPLKIPIIKEPAIIKIDVEGHEIHVIRGIELEKMAKLPSLLIELNQSLSKRFELVQFLKTLGYNSFTTTTEIIIKGQQSRSKKTLNLIHIAGFRKFISSFNRNSLVNLEKPEQFSLEQLLIMKV